MERGDRGIAVPCFNSGARKGWVVISMLHSHYCQEREPKPISRRMGGPYVLTGFEPQTTQPVASCSAYCADLAGVFPCVWGND